MGKTPLIATPTVDRNGKSTTVYRKVASSAPVKGLPVPTLGGSKQGAQKPSTPLPVPEPITFDDTKFNAYRKSLKVNDIVALGKELTRNEAALVRDILSRGHVSELSMLRATGYMGILSAGERIKHYDYNLLLILERICRDEGANIIGDSPHNFADAVEGLGIRRRESDHITIPPIATEEELDSLAAVVKMMMFVSSREESSISQQISERKKYRTVDGDRLNGRAFKNHSFTALLRERYEEYPRILGFVADRGVPSNKAGVEALRDYLDSGEDHHTAMAVGWL